MITSNTNYGKLTCIMLYILCHLHGPFYPVFSVTVYRVSGIIPAIARQDTYVG